MWLHCCLCHQVVEILSSDRSQWNCHMRQQWTSSSSDLMSVISFYRLSNILFVYMYNTQICTAVTCFVSCDLSNTDDETINASSYHISIKSEMFKPVSLWTQPLPFFTSTTHVACCPSGPLVTLKAKTPPIFFTNFSPSCLTHILHS